MNSNTTRYIVNKITPDQADYRRHVVFDRPRGQKKIKIIRQLKPYEKLVMLSVHQSTLFHKND